MSSLNQGHLDEYLKQIWLFTRIGLAVKSVQSYSTDYDSKILSVLVSIKSKELIRLDVKLA